MSERVTMPALGESVTEGTVTRWLKNVGDTVEVDEPLLEVSTDKVDTEIPSPVAGTIQEILVEEDETVEVGADLAVIGDGDAPASSDSGDDAQEAPAEETPAEEPQADEPAAEAEEAPAEEPQAEEAPAAESSSGDGDGTTVAMPALGESVTEGTVSRWLKAEGDTVEVDEPLLEVSTDKVDTEIPSPVAGTLTKILVQEDETVEVGADLAIVGGSGGGSTESAPAEEPKQEAPTEEPKAEEPKEEPKAEEPKEEPKQEAPKEEPKQEAPKEEPKQEAPKEEPKAEEPKAEPKQEVPAASGGDAAAYVTPLVRKLAADNGIDLAQVTGTGIGGRIRKQDVLEAAKAKNQPQEAAAPAAAPAGAPAAAAPAGVPAGLESNVPQSKRGTREKMTRLRKVIAERMVESLRVSAQLTTVVEVDMTKVARVRDAAKAEFAQREGTKLSFLPFIAQATAEALKAHPGVNASVEGDEIVYHSQENLSIAVDTERGLLTPVVKNAGDLNVAGLARAIADVADRTRNNKITPDDLSGGTFTITNTGSRGALFDTPILNQPQVAMLGTGAIVRRPVVITTDDGGETLAIRSMMYLALTYDHRVVDGADAARFLGTVKARLEEGRFEA
ncbi:2-oxoglutarate dehydrogenase, E2 component, dihydrolipoamide succinyltransferase [Janibacter hoylei]|uniref:2-oxoglutarate dehydrogenase, E2 component, dihydrolipoamide succinyltransferase n=1 Tax=Janibacter hoylei TaxID=364298 RepID=UPI0021A588DE|nr:2-oxoglutarate dehydrogenase, E2 component, dihydrolipoamide succinyltransferase [Janibacter hoylei]MCT2292863.1 2-oxoglutarate dehydrogenase, E2 component, dihydrolipoamide succinyltransferase [Janibacter hoylei]